MHTAAESEIIVAALDREISAMLRNFVTGKPQIALMTAWLRGWDSANLAVADFAR